MGGIAGIVHWHDDPPDRAEARALSAAVAHRGRDDKGMFFEAPAILTHRRNAATPGGRAQPVSTLRHALVFDGRLYDHADLSRQVSDLGVQMETSGDADLLLHAWEQWGRQVLERLDGAYAFVIWDRKEHVLHLVRDPMGIRPLYYAHRGHRFAFASEPGALLQLPWVSRELALPAIGEYLAFRYVHAPRTLFTDIHALPPGGVLRVGQDGVHLDRHGIAPFSAPNTPTPTSTDTLGQFDQRFRRAVDRRIERRGGTGVLLSGGVDSSLIASIAAQSQSDLASYHVSFEETGASEAAYAARVASLLQTEHRHIQVGTQDFIDAFLPTVRAMGAPVPDPAAISQYVLYEETARDVRVVLTGDGGDEVFGGRRIAQSSAGIARAKRLNVLPRPVRGLVRKGLSNMGMPNLAYDPQGFGRGRLVGGSEVFNAERRAALFRHPDVHQADVRRSVLEPLYDGLNTDPLNAVLGIYQRGWLPEDSLARSDRVSAAVGLEVRYPVLDSSVVGLLNGLPGAWKVRNKTLTTTNKWPVRQLLRGKLPDTLVHRRKQRLPSPLNQWLRGAGRDFLDERLEALLTDRWGLWRPDPLRKLARAHLEGADDHGARLWGLIFLDAWLDHVRG